MKKFNFLKTIVLALILLAGTGSAWAETVTYTISAKNTLTTTGTAPSGSSATLVETYSTSKQMTSGNSQTVTLSGYFGYKITSITLSMRSNSKDGSGNFIYKIDGGADNTIIATNPFNNAAWNGAWSSSYVDVTKAVDILCGTTSTVLKIAATVNSLYCQSYSLTYESVSVNPTVATPTFSVAAGTHTYPQSVTIETTTEDADIYYTLDGETPTASSTPYTGAISLPLGVTTVKAIGTKTDFDNSTVAEAEYTINLAAPVATDATNAWKNRFFANWNAVTGATSYELNVYTKEGGANASDLFISEYVEGTSSNKYIEIYNGTGAAVDLSDYKLQLFANGVTSTTNDVALTGTLAHGATKVYKNSSANLSLPSGVTAEDNNACNFNGNDAIALYKVSTSSYVDIFGVIGSDPGAAWTGSGGYTTVDKTLVRKSSVLGGITTSPTGTGAGAFTTLTTEWDMYDKDVVSNLGTHTFDGSETITPITGSPFTVSGGSTSSYEVTGLTQKVQYYYTVKAKNGSFESAASNEVSAMIDMDTGVNNTAALSGISVQNGNLKVSATAGTLIEVYNIAGQKIVSQTAKEGVNTIAIAQRGAMIVKIGTETVKVVF